MEKDILKQKQERFKAMGIPMPMEKTAFEQPVTNVKDPNMLKRIQEIKNGAKKGEFNAILSSGEKNSFNPLPVPKQKSQPNIKKESKAPEVQSFQPSTLGSELDMYERMFSGELGATPVATPASLPNPSIGSRISESMVPDSTGTDFLNEFRNRLHSKISTSGTIQKQNNFGFKNQNNNPSDLNEIESKIESISASVAKKVALETIKTVLGEYLSEKKGLNENAQNTFQRVKDDIIKIDGKYFKIMPVKIKNKT